MSKVKYMCIAQNSRKVCCNPGMGFEMAHFCEHANRWCRGFEKVEEEDEMKNNTHEELVRQIREAGESLIKNAESIAGSEKCLDGLKIEITFEADEAPRIRIIRDFTPEKFVERKMNE